MNLKVLKWLLAHRDAILQIVEIAKAYNKSLPLIEQWNIADKIARVVIPIFQAEAISPLELVTECYYAQSFEEDRDMEILATGGSVAALGIDWKMLVETILPLVVAILKMLASEDEE